MTQHGGRDKTSGGFSVTLCHFGASEVLRSLLLIVAGGEDDPMNPHDTRVWNISRTFRVFPWSGGLVVWKLFRPDVSLPTLRRAPLPAVVQRWTLYNACLSHIARFRNLWERHAQAPTLVLESIRSLNLVHRSTSSRT